LSPFDQAVLLVTEAAKREGFGVLIDIEVTAHEGEASLNRYTPFGGFPAPSWLKGTASRSYPAMTARPRRTALVI
jgi:hypothetical protein